jgi:hypothetical protein
MGPSADQAADGKRVELSERAKHRLRIAARILRQRGLDFPKQGDFYSQIQVRRSSAGRHTGRQDGFAFAVAARYHFDRSRSGSRG